MTADRPEVEVPWAGPSARLWLWFSLPIALLAMVGSAAGIFVDGVYSRETPNWSAQAVTTDIINLVVAYPALLLLALAASRGSLRAYLAWLGVLGYSVYSYAIYAFDVHFGRLFLVYVSVFGLSVYGLIGGLTSLNTNLVKGSFTERTPVRSTAATLIAISVLAYLLWLSAIIPSMIANTTPHELVETGLASNPVHVLDMAVFLPAVGLAGALVAKRHPLGFCLAPLVLTTMILIGLGIVCLQPVLAASGQTPVWPLAAGFAILALIQLVVLARFLGAIR